MYQLCVIPQNWREIDRFVFSFLFQSFVNYRVIMTDLNWQNKSRQRLSSTNIASHHIHHIAFHSRLSDRLTADMIIRIIHDWIKFPWHLRAESGTLRHVINRGLYLVGANG